MSKKLKPKRMSSLGSLRSPDEVTQSIESLTETTKPITKADTPIAESAIPKKNTVTKVKAKPKIKPAPKAKKVTKQEIVKFIKMEDEHHMVAKIAAAKKRISIKAYVEGLVRKDNPDMFE